MSDQPTPEAVEAVARVILMEAENTKQFEDAAWVEGYDIDMARAALAFIRDAIHRDGAGADAIRQTLGLRVERQRSWFPLDYTKDDDGIHDGRRVVGEWQEDTP